MNALSAVAVAASYGLDQLRADGYRVDQAQFDEAVKVVAALARIFEPPLSAPAPTRKEPDNGYMSATEVANVYPVTPTAVRLAAREGRLRGDKDDRGHWRFTPDDVAEWRPRGT